MDRNSIWELSVQTTVSALGICSMSWCRTSEGFTLQVVSYADVLITRVLEFNSYLFCLWMLPAGWLRTNERVGWSHGSGLKPIRAHLWAGGWALSPVSAAGRGWNPSDLWLALWQKMKSLKEVHKDTASKRTLVTLGWALPPPTRNSGNGGGRRKRAL